MGRLGASSNCGDALLIQGLGLGKTFALTTLVSHVPFKLCFCVVMPMNLYLTDVVSFFMLTKSGVSTIL